MPVGPSHDDGNFWLVDQLNTRCATVSANGMNVRTDHYCSQGEQLVVVQAVGGGGEDEAGDIVQEVDNVLAKLMASIQKG